MRRPLYQNTTLVLVAPRLKFSAMVHCGATRDPSRDRRSTVEAFDELLVGVGSRGLQPPLRGTAQTAASCLCKIRYELKLRRANDGDHQLS